MSDKDIMNEEQTTSQEQEEVSETNQKLSAEHTTDDGLPSLEEKLEKEIIDLKDKYLRLYSEFDNFRRRTAKERLDLITTASEDLIKEILPIIDDFERAFKASEKESDVVKVREGNQLVFQKLVKTLENKGVRAMEDLIGNSFDPDKQEAITQIPAPNEEMKGKVIDVVEKGYTMGEKVIRYAKVVTGA